MTKEWGGSESNPAITCAYQYLSPRIVANLSAGDALSMSKTLLLSMQK